MKWWFNQEKFWFLLYFVHSIEGWPAFTNHKVARKKQQKDERYIGKLLRKMSSDTTSFSVHVNGKSNKSRDVKFIISKNLEPPLRIDTPFPPSPPSKKKKSSTKLLKCVYLLPCSERGEGRNYESQVWKVSIYSRLSVIQIMVISR